MVEGAGAVQSGSVSHQHGLCLQPALLGTAEIAEDCVQGHSVCPVRKAGQAHKSYVIQLPSCDINTFPFIARMVSLREVVLKGCSNVRFPEHVTELDNLRRLKTHSFSTYYAISQACEGAKCAPFISVSICHD